MFYKNCLYKHKNNTTVAFEMQKAFYVKEKDLWKLRVSWHNIGARHQPWPMAISQRIEIKGEDVKNWMPMSFSARPPLPPPLFIGAFT